MMCRLTIFLVLCASCQFVYSRWAPKPPTNNQYDVSDRNSKGVEILIEYLTPEDEEKLRQELFKFQLMESIRKTLGDVQTKSIVHPEVKIEKTFPVKRHCMGPMTMMICV
ncbi:hypothetical protein WA026_016002 [Henosepilachna vigintioctopunctata]|uniref:Uncharacterized protein n=1 Tax=Henosepilachna vigintioctopunctata TaxID=420089 RepID=A0AAW1TZE9_9CUCU